MAIRIFCTTFFTALATWAAAPALAFDLAATSPGAQPAATQRQPAEIISLDTSVFAAPPVVTTAGDGPLAQFSHDGPIGWTGKIHGQGQPATEPGSLPLLGAAAIALLVAQLRRSRYPMP